MSSAPPAASIRFATRADALGIAEMSRDFIEYGLGWSWTRERILRSLRQRDTNAIVAVRDADRAGFGDHEVRRGGSAPAAARGQAGASALRHRQRDAGVARALRPRSPASAASRSRRAPATTPRAPSTAVTAMPRRSCCPATTAAARRACGWSRLRPVAHGRRCDGAAAAAALAALVALAGACGAALAQDAVIDAEAACRSPPSALPRAPTSAQSGAASRASRRSVEAPRRARLRVASARRHVFNAGAAEADRGRDAVVQSWAEIVEGRTIACAGAPGIVQIGGEPTIALRAVPTSCSACTRRAGLPRRHVPDGVDARRAGDGVWRVLFDGSASTPQPMDRPRSGRAWVRGTGDVGLRVATKRRVTAGEAAGSAARRSAAPCSSGLITPLLNMPRSALPTGGIERQRCRAAAARRSRDRAPRWRGRAIRVAPRPGRWRWPGGGAAPAAAGRSCAASENWSTALASARCSSAACRSMPTGSRARSALPSAASRVSTARQARFELAANGSAGSFDRGHQPCTLVRSSWALAISLSAIASGLTLKCRRRWPGGDAGDLVGVELARRRRRRAASTRRSTARPWRWRRRSRRLRPAPGLGLAGLGRRRLACRRPGPAAACQRDVRSSWCSPGGAGGAGTCQHGRSIGPAGDDFRDFLHDPAIPGGRAFTGSAPRGARRRRRR